MLKITRTLSCGKMKLKLIANMTNEKCENVQKVFDLNRNVIECGDAKAVKIAAHQLKSGNVIALPTDTVYGVACSANDRIAIQKLYQLKGRDADKPVAICVSSIEQLRRYGEASHLPNDLLCRLLPGPVTLVLDRTKHLNNPYLNPGVEKIGIRIPAYEFIQKVSTKFVEPIALTSANRSGEKSTLEVQEFAHLWLQLGAVFDGGHLGDVENERKQRDASTVVDLSRPGFYEIIRNGIACEDTVKLMNEFSLKTI